MPTVKDLASQMSRAFESSTRTNGDEFRKFKDDSPQWMTDVVRAAHRTGSGDWDVMMPDDWRFAFVEAACDALADHDDEDAARDSIEADIYTSDLTRWLNSRADRYGYCDEFMDEFGADFGGTLSLLQGGQHQEKMEVFNLVLDALRDLATDEDETDDGGDPSDEELEAMGLSE